MEPTFEINKRLISNNEESKKIIRNLYSLITFVDSLGESFFGKTFVCASKTFDCSYLLQSINMTLDNIVICCEKYCIADAMTLLRKFKDDLWFILYVLTFKDNLSELTNSNSIYNNVNDWVNNSLEHLTTKKIIDEIFKINELESLDSKYSIKSTLKKMAETMDDYVHSNGLKFYNSTICNIDEIILENLNLILNIATNNLLFFVIILAIRFPYCLSSSDYEDYLDYGVKPPKGYQYWIAPYIEDFIRENKHFLEDNIIDFLKDYSIMDFGN